MSKRNKLENKSLRRRERRDHVPQICLASPNANAGKLARKLKSRPLEKLFTLFKRAVRRARTADRLIAKVPAGKTASPLLLGLSSHIKAFGRVVLVELDRREKLISRPAPLPLAEGISVPKSETLVRDDARTGILYGAR